MFVHGGRLEEEEEEEEEEEGAREGEREGEGGMGATHVVHLLFEPSTFRLQRCVCFGQSNQLRV